MAELEIENEKLTTEFGNFEENVILSLAFENSEFFMTVMPFMELEFFSKATTKFIFALIFKHYKEKSIIITRAFALDYVKKHLTTDMPFQEIIDIISKPLDPRDMTVVMSNLVEWCRKRAYSKLYDQESIESHSRGDYAYVEQVVEQARRVNDFDAKFYFFFSEYEALFQKENEEKFTTGFQRLDSYLNNGGPSRGEVVCCMAPTGVGKSIFLVNNGAGSILDEKNVLHVTMELTKMKTAARYLGCFTNQWIDARYSEDVQQKMRASLIQKKDTYKSQLVIVEYPPDDISVDTIHMNIDVLKRQYGIKIDVVIIDYMELLISRNQKMFDKDYNIQKKVATEVCRLAKKEKVVVFTAFQTNRGGNENVNSKGGKDSSKFIELDKVAESYGKTMSVDYIVTLNQTKSEYKGSDEESKEDISSAGLRFYIAKNRNGPKFQSIDAFVNYYTMKMREA